MKWLHLKKELGYNCWLLTVNFISFQGATVKNDGDRVVIGRIVKGGAAEKSGKPFHYTPLNLTV